MAKAAVILVLVPLLSLLPFSSLALTQDFCVADLNSRDTPAGYPCKPQTDVTADDFFYGGLAKPGPNISPFDTSVAMAFVNDFPGVNGLDISGARIDMAPGGVAPLHTHPEGTELFYLLEGTLVSGFISSTGNTVYMKTMKKGDLFVFPLGLLHFQYNVGRETAVGIAAYSSPNPGLLIIDFAVFKSTLAADVVEKITFLQQAEVKRLKGVFGGSG
ncbi:hypothetical protein PR202_gb02983 [Eleusine coracana subsp. coracana]|uniref:Germin-like protein n=1 Tax=Eleusine coracana subsp. coracana TaxID=191504 RepID=A0AAV5DYG9_ELECO|nr:hypothetical protein QOZ80_8BG0662390 [Eleusine coracana subsp. coracana]GJN16033.1 hypothetical protein PR202_gb02983 [Eleusine coracana subsp. coracana]